MIKNYLLVAFRSLRKNKSYIFINTAGLGIALACCITAYLILAFNLEFDTFHDAKKVARIYKVHAHFREKDGRETQSNNAPVMLAPTAAQEIAGISRFTRYARWSGFVRNDEKDKAFSENVSFVDSTFFDLFDFPLKQGNHKALHDKYSIFLNEKTATKYFEDENPIGKTLTLNFANDFQVDVVVGGVFQKIPENSSFTMDFLMRIENFVDLHKLMDDSWGDWRDPATFFELETASAENAANISQQLAKYIPIRNKAKADANVIEYRLEHFKSNFTSDDINWSYANMRIGAAPIIIFSAMAGLILLIACFNLTNTSIAMTSKRIKEVGVRKAVGAIRRNIIMQFLFETFLSITLSLIVGLLVAQVIVPKFTQMWNLPYNLTDLNGLNLFVALLILMFLASLLAGIYPALFNSKFKPVALLKGQVNLKGTNGLTRTLISFQFALSVIVLAGGVIFIQNGKFQEAIDFGYDKDKIIVVDLQSKSEFEAMESALAANPKVQEVSYSDHHLGFGGYEYPMQYDTGEYRVQHMGVGKNYFNTMGLKLLEGRFPTHESATDRVEAVVVNRAFVDKLLIKDPLDKIVTIHSVRRHITGVIENHIDNVFSSREAQAFVFYPADTTQVHMMQVKAEKADLVQVKADLEATWKKLYPTKPFESRFQEDILLGETKKVNGNLKQIFIFLTILGGLLSASGIFSLASLNIARRTKEIGIRKALGASVTNVVGLLNREFLLILTLAGLIGSVTSFFLIDAMLEEIYKVHIPVGILPVVLCDMTIFLIWILTTSMTIFKAARANPVKSLRTE